MKIRIEWRIVAIIIFLAGSTALGQKVETVNGIQVVHNEKTGQWGKNPKIRLELIRTLGDVNAEDEALAFYMPSGVALDSKGNIYILDTGNHRVQKFSPDGRYLSTIGSQGQGPGEFQYPDSIDIDSQDMIFISDPNNQRIQVLTREGVEHKTLRIIKDSIGNIRCTKSGNLIMAGGRTLIRFGPDTEEEQQLPMLVKKLDLDGNVTQEFGEPLDFKHILLNRMGNQVKFTVDKNGNIYLVFLFQNRIEKYSPEGKLLWRADRKLDYSLEPPKDKGKMETRGGGVSIQMPRMNQCSNGIAVDGTGRVWAVTQARQIREEERVGTMVSMSNVEGRRTMAMKAEGNTDLQTTDMYKLDVFSPDGILLGSFPLNHFVDGIYIKGERILLWDAMRGAKFYEYKVIDR